MDQDLRKELDEFKDNMIHHINKLSNITKSMSIRLNDILKENEKIKKQNIFLNNETKKLIVENKKLTGIYNRLQSTNINTEHKLHSITENLSQINQKLHTKT
jgi:hypothetical protein